MTRSKTIIFSAFVITFGWNNAHSQAGIPFVFEPNTPARAEEINSNFAALQKSIDGTSVRFVEQEFSTPVGQLGCNDNEILIGGGCFCTGAPARGTNFGTLHTCLAESDGLSYVGGCMPMAQYDPDLPSSSVIVQAACVSTLGMDSAVAKAMTSPSDSNHGASKFHQLKTIIDQYTDAMNQ